MEEGLWRPMRPTKKGKVLKKKAKVTDATEQEKVPMHKAENPFEHYTTNETLAMRCQNEMGQLFTMYDGRFKDVEVRHRFGDLVNDVYPEIKFTYNPIVLVIGERGVGKTTFIHWLLGWKNYPAMSDPKHRKINFKSTEHFIVLEQDNISPKIEGARVVENPSKPFHILKPFQPEINQCLMLYSYPDSQLLQDVTIVDTPSYGGKVSSPAGQFMADVTETLSFLADRVYFLVDAMKVMNSRDDSILSEETVDLSYLLVGDEKKVSIVMTKCESVTPEQALFLEQKIVWSFSKLLDSWLAPKVFFGSFLDALLPPGLGNKELIDHWHAEIYSDFFNMQRHKVLHLADCLVLRGQQLITLSFVVRLIIAKRTYFRKHLILKHLSKIFSAAQEICKRPLGEFPSVDIVHQKLHEVDINTLQLPSSGMLQEVERMIYREIPEIIEDHQRKMRHLLDDIAFAPSFSSLDLDKQT